MNLNSTKVLKVIKFSIKFLQSMTTIAQYYIIIENIEVNFTFAQTENILFDSLPAENVILAHLSAKLQLTVIK